MKMVAMGTITGKRYLPCGGTMCGGKRNALKKPIVITRTRITEKEKSSRHFFCQDANRFGLLIVPKTNLRNPIEAAKQIPAIN